MSLDLKSGRQSKFQRGESSRAGGRATEGIILRWDCKVSILGNSRFSANEKEFVFFTVNLRKFEVNQDFKGGGRECRNWFTGEVGVTCKAVEL